MGYFGLVDEQVTERLEREMYILEEKVYMYLILCPYIYDGAYISYSTLFNPYLCRY